ncbi:MAG: penicillin-binding protein A [Oscillibacter sp.]|nr:penicillin-binding protein A [Oscillibacter sp.]
MDHKEMQNARLYLLAAFLVAALLAFLAILYDTQIIHYEDYSAKSIRSIVRPEKVEASRGIITDRNGRVLVSNRSTYNLTFDSSILPPNADANSAILRLLELCRDQEISWIDNLPISYEASYQYTIDQMDSLQKNRFLGYLKNLSYSRDALGAYLLRNSDLVPPPADDEKTSASAGGTASSDSASEPGKTLSPTEHGQALVDRLTSANLTADLLNKAGITPVRLMEIMRTELKVDPDLSLAQARLMLGVQYELSLRTLNTSMDAYVLAEDIDTAFISMLSDGNYLGAKVVNSSVRVYETTYAAHILGYMGSFESPEEYKNIYKDQGYDYNDQIGRTGVEAAFEKYLKGTDGKRMVSSNDSGKITGEFYQIEPEPGAIVELTIDLDFQQQVEEILAATIQNMNRTKPDAERGAGAAVIKVGSGEVLALASYPTFDISTFRQNMSEINADPGRPMFNRATVGTYPPGSTLKPLTAAAALLSGNTTLKEKIRDTGVWRYPGDEKNSYARCWYHAGHGKLNITQAITHSCNYFFAEMGYRMGMDLFREYLVKFGLGVSSGIEISENKGTLPENPEGQNQAPWAAFGQSNQLYSPLQLANYIATLVSGGKHYSAHLLKAAKSYDNSSVIAVGNTDPVDVIDIGEANLQAIKQGMRGLVTGSLAPYFRNCVVDAGAKTGTAQVFSNVNDNSVFVCFAPYDEPEIAVAIALERGGSGSVLASTAVEILNAYFTQDETSFVITGENQLLP